MTALTRRSVFMGAAALLAAPFRPPFFDGQTISLDGADYVLTDIVAPSAAPLAGGAEPGAEFALAALEAIMAGRRTPAFSAPPRDRWGRGRGPLRLIGALGEETTMQRALLEAGAARVFPQTDDDALLDSYVAAEDAARAARRGLWALAAYALREARDERRVAGFQIYHGAVRSTGEHKGRVYFNFGEDFRADLTATAALGAFRRWRRKDELSAYAGRAVELRGIVHWINGPSIELRHERQLRLL
jgi:endonuclease YncB( thermonuclease family)